MKNKKINKSEKAYIRSISKKALVFLVFILLLFLCLSCRILYIQFIKGPEYKKSAYTIQTVNKIISPKRGSIYDCTGKPLAISANVDTVTINPSSIKYKDGSKVEPEVITHAFVDIFDLEYDSVFAKVTSDSSVETIIKKVEKDKIDILNSWLSEKKITSGINIDDDVKRYYQYNTLAAQLIGFCGDDNTGLEGLEFKWNSILTGTPRKNCYFFKCSKTRNS